MNATMRSTARMVLPPFLVSKFLALAVPLLIVWQNSTARGFPSWSEFRQAFAWWDASIYLHIAASGYPATTQGQDGFLYAFLPGYPLLISAVAVVFRDAVVSGVLVSAVAELVALRFIAGLVIDERDRDAGRFAVWLMALWPFAFFLSAVYSESAFFACAAAALYYGRRGRIGLAALLAMASCAIRVTGVALIPFLLIEYARRHRARPHPELLLIVLIPLPLAVFALYSQQHAGDLLAFLHAQSSPSFNHSAAWPWNGAKATWDAAVHTDLPASTSYVFAAELVFGILGLAACAAAFVGAFVYRRFPASLAVYCGAVWVLATSLSFWRSVPRYELGLFPLAILAADVTERRPAWRGALIAASAGLMAYGASRYAVDAWLG